MPNKGSHEQRKDRIVAFFERTRSLANDQQTTVVVGGDFNLAVPKWEAELRSKQTVKILKYKKSPYRHGDLIDTFVVVYPDKEEDRTSCVFKSIVPVCPFPLAGYTGNANRRNADGRFLIDFQDYMGTTRFKIIPSYSQEELQNLERLCKESKMMPQEVPYQMGPPITMTASYPQLVPQMYDEVPGNPKTMYYYEKPCWQGLDIIVRHSFGGFYVI